MDGLKHWLTALPRARSVRPAGPPFAGSTVRHGRDVGGPLNKAQAPASMLDPAPQDSSLMGRSFGRFRILAKLGQGGIATVWKAHDELLGRTVALKLLDESLSATHKTRLRFVHEAQTASLLDHPNIVTVFDAGESGSRAYMALTLVD